MLSFVVSIHLILIHSAYSSRLFDQYYYDDDLHELDGDDINLEHSDRQKNKAHIDKELAKKYAPYLIYDKASTEFPMDPEIFFNYEIKRDYAQKMQNHIMDTVTNPTFYRIYECSHSHIVIDYWFFYGWQGILLRSKHSKIKTYTYKHSKQRKLNVPKYHTS